MLKLAILALGLVALSGCGTAYFSPRVDSFSDGATKMRVVAMTPESLLRANASTYRPKSLPAVFFQTAGAGSGLRGSGPTPRPSLTEQPRPNSLQTRLPPELPAAPYQIGVGDVVLLATPQAGSTVEQLSGLLAAQNARQGYTVQDDGTIAIPNVGRVQVANLTIEEAEAELFQRLVENQIDPTFSLEIAEFNSKKVSIGGAVARPTVAPIALTPLFLDEALAAAGGISAQDQDLAAVRIYRDGTLYQIPVDELYSNRGLRRIQLADGDSVFVDTNYELDLAQAYFEEQIRLAEFRQRERINALNALQAEVAIRQSNLADARANYLARLDLGSVDRDYVYLTGEVETQARYPLPFDQTATLADALYDNGGIPTETGNVAQIYVLRASADPRDFGAVTAWQLDARNAVNFTLATRFELRPNDVIFVAEQPITRWSRVIQQITPSLITTTVAAGTN